MSLWFVTPAWQRYDLSAVCFDQRRIVIDTLAARGIEAHCVVIADDENLDLARARGFDTIERDNNWLGRKFNDGMEYAGRRGARWIVPIGSDSWIDPAYFDGLAEGVTRTARNYAVVQADRLAELSVCTTSGAGPYVFERDTLAPSGFRPAIDRIRRGVDGSTIAGLRVDPRWSFHDLHPLQYVGFRGTPHITRYSRLWANWGRREDHHPWRTLGAIYPAPLVAAARRVMA